MRPARAIWICKRISAINDISEWLRDVARMAFASNDMTH